MSIIMTGNFGLGLHLLELWYCGSLQSKVRKKTVAKNIASSVLQSGRISTTCMHGSAIEIRITGHTV